MIRVAAALFSLGIAAASPALATADRRAASNETNANSSSASGSAGAGNHLYVRSACDTRRPSCRKWRALAHDRIQNARDGN
ncbi:MAG: hypothetical protein MUC37_07105 [Hyphomicrobium sp.]|nr:hypothetical protein [Hyphomicrobium sp.]